MQMFFETNDNKYVNLREVTSIAFEEYSDRYQIKKYKVIFNMNYGISLRNHPDTIISDYVYSVYTEKSEFTEALLYLMNLVDEYQWLKMKEPRIVNPEHISFVTQDYRKNRIILNLASSVSMHNDKSLRTSDFIYLNCEDTTEFNERLNNIREQLDGLIL
ncbi:MAG: hypothetical protein J7L15_04875 [Clostridiales bacterium]|nr:hypothetical protein [Clostridiales bacterium]